MTLQVTTRLVTAVLVATAGAAVAILAGRAEAAVLVTPWVVLLVLGLTGRRRDRITAQLSLEQDRVVVGNDAALDVAVAGLDGGWVEAVWRPPAEPGQTVAVGDVAGRDGRARLRCAIEASAWGTHEVGRAEILVHHPWGLTVARGVARQPLALRVHPRPIDLRRLLAPWFVRRLTGAHRSRASARGVEYADIRPFGPGDSTRDINWRASARSAELMVSDRHPDRSTHAILLVDSFTESGHDAAAVLGQSIEAAVALAESHLSVSDRVGLVDLGGVVRWVAPGSGRHQLQRLVDALLATRLHRSEAERPITSIPRLALPPRSFVLALSPLLDQRFVDALFALRAAGHDVAVVEFPPAVDPASDRWAGGEVAALAVRMWAAERDVMRDRLIERGVAVAERRLSTSPEADLRPADEPDPWDHVLHRLAAARQRVGPVVMR